MLRLHPGAHGPYRGRSTEETRRDNLHRSGQGAQALRAGGPVESPVSRPDLARSYPLVLTTGARNISFLHSQHRNLQKLRRMMPDPLLEIHTDDAESRGIRSGDTVDVTSPRGRVRVKAHVTDSILPGVVHLPHHWPDEANANNLSDDIHLDPISGFPAFKSQLCQVTKVM